MEVLVLRSIHGHALGLPGGGISDITTGRLENNGAFCVVLWLQRTQVLSMSFKTFSPALKFPQEKEAGLNAKKKKPISPKGSSQSGTSNGSTLMTSPDSVMTALLAQHSGPTCWSYTWGGGRSSPGGHTGLRCCR